MEQDREQEKQEDLYKVDEKYIVHFLNKILISSDECHCRIRLESLLFPTSYTKSEIDTMNLYRVIAGNPIATHYTDNTKNNITVNPKLISGIYEGDTLRRKSNLHRIIKKIDRENPIIIPESIYYTLGKPKKLFFSIKNDRGYIYHVDVHMKKIFDGDLQRLISILNVTPETLRNYLHGLRSQTVDFYIIDQLGLRTMHTRNNETEEIL